MKKTIISIISVMLTVNVWAQNITQIEYFIDTDPGYNNGIAIPITPDSVISNHLFNIDINIESYGLHTFYIRSKDINGNWSITNNQYLYKYAPISIIPNGGVPTILKIEYFIDTDPGTGNGVNVPITSDSLISSFSFNVDIQNLSYGMHTFYVRTKDANGNWSITNNQYLYKYAPISIAPNGNVPTIVKMEYYIDTDPGIGNGINVPIVNDTIINSFAFNANAMGLIAGPHTLYIRSKDINGKWSITNNINFTSCPFPTAIADYNYVQENLNFAFFNSSQNMVSCVWNFGDGSTSTIFNPFHTYALAGVYNVCMIAANVATCIPYKDTMCKTVHINGVNSIYPDSAGNAGQVTVDIYGQGFGAGSKAKLVKGIVDTISAFDSLITNFGGQRLRVTFDLQNADTGYYNVLIEVPGDTTMMLLNGFKITPGIYGDITLQIQGVPNVRIGSIFQFNIVATNTGNNNRRMPVVTLYSFNYNTIGFNTSDLINLYHSLPIIFSDSSEIVTIAPGQTLIKTIYSKALSAGSGSYGLFQLNDSISLRVYDSLLAGINIISSPLASPSNSISLQNNPPVGCSTNGCSIPKKLEWLNLNPPNSINPQGIFTPACDNHDVCYGTPGLQKEFCDNRFGQDMTTICNNISDPNERKTCLRNSAVVLRGVRWFGTDPYNTAQANDNCTGPNPYLVPVNSFGYCEPSFNSGNNVFRGPCYAPLTVGSYDPNVKVGPGLNDSSNNYISGNSSLNYFIHFENDSSATAPAQVVTILDTLDKNVFDISTFQLGSITIGDTLIPIQSGLKLFHTRVDLSNIGTPFVCDILATLNDSLGIAKWEFITLDKNTLLPVTGIFDGFLPPNINSQEGEASVSYSIKVYDTVSLNTSINNKASIYFDFNPVKVTDTWHNKIDNVNPISCVQALPKYSDSLFTINWSGNDTASGIFSYDIYYSVNNQSYQPLLINTLQTSYNFIGLIDSTYSFYSVARDKAGNKETFPIIYDARTHIRDCNVVLNPTIDTSGNVILCHGDSTKLKVNGGNFYLWSNGAISDSIYVYQSGNYSVIISDTFGCVRISDTTNIILDSCFTTALSLRIYLEGYYIGNGLMAPVLKNQGIGSNLSITDTIEVELRNIFPPYNIVSSTKSILENSGYAIANFSVYPGFYYLAIKHRNGMQTWSALPVYIPSVSIYNFTNSVNNAYGGNMKEMESNVWAFFSGDFNKDENIDLLDLSILEAYIPNFQFGYYETDLNGDGNIDLLDSPIVEENINNFVFSIHP